MEMRARLLDDQEKKILRKIKIEKPSLQSNGETNVKSEF